MMFGKIVWLSLALAVLVVVGCQRQPGDSGGPSEEAARPSPGRGKTLQIKGSDTMVNLGQAWAEAYMKAHPDAPLAVTGGGSGTGIATLINGTCDLAQSSREIKSEERETAKQRGLDVQEFKVALDALTVVVHPSNPVSRLTIAQLSDIFTGKVTNWQQVGGKDARIVPLSRERNSGTHVFFLEHVVRKGDAKGREEFAPGVLMLPSSQAIADEVAQNAEAIGYFGLGYVDKTRHKAIAVAQVESGPYVEPSSENATSGKYPIARPLYFYTPRKPDGTLKSFIEFAQSPEGQRIVQQVEFVPLRQVG